MPNAPTKSRKPSAKTKAAKIIELLHRKTGASIAELAKATGWQMHSVRGFLSGALKKRTISIANSREENRDRRYFIVEQIQ